MYNLKNSVRLIGHVGLNPEVKVLSGNRKLAKFSLATSDNYKNSKGEWETQTQWHNIVAWGKVASKAEKQISKGAEVIIEGKLMHRQYEDSQGVKRYITEIQVSDLLVVKARN
ncbi:MAG: single-stranded DNA-binding protein [Flavobacteriales bacterium]|nr:single-stranded DNA-binding protein [Flavobacteriales bacterium]